MFRKWLKLNILPHKTSIFLPFMKNYCIFSSKGAIRELTCVFFEAPEPRKAKLIILNLTPPTNPLNPFTTRGKLQRFEFKQCKVK